jgi:hypothetical protein
VLLLLAVPAALVAEDRPGVRPAPRPASGVDAHRPTPARGAGAAAGPVGGRRPVTADSVVVEKAFRRLTVYADGLPARTYDVALGRAPVGAKVRAGDLRTPEGLYHVEARNPASRYHRALRLSYPNATTWRGRRRSACRRAATS